MFLQEKGININEKNYMNLFIAQKRFEKQYGISNKELLAKYDYKKYKAQISTQELGKETINVETVYQEDTKKAMEEQEKNNNMTRNIRI